MGSSSRLPILAPSATSRRGDELPPGGERAGECPCSPAPSPPLRVRPLHDRPHLDAPQACWRDLRGHPDGVVQILGLEQIEPAQLLLRFGERPGGGERFAVPDPDRRSRLNRLKGIRGYVVPALPEHLVIVQRLVNAGVPLALRQSVQLLLLYVD